MDKNELELRIQAELYRANAAVRRAKQSVERLIQQCEDEAARVKRLQVKDINQKVRHKDRLDRIRLQTNKAKLERAYKL